MSTADLNTEPPEWRRGWRIGFGVFLGAALAIGLYSSLAGAPAEHEAVLDRQPPPTEEPTAEAGSEDGEEDDDNAEDEDAEGADDDDNADGDDEDAEELIDAARDPEDTTVQVLDASGDADMVSDAVAVLTDLGYDIVVVNDAAQNQGRTAVRYTDGNEDEARALRARDERVAVVEENTSLSESVDLHVLVGQDWRQVEAGRADADGVP